MFTLTKNVLEQNPIFRHLSEDEKNDVTMGCIKKTFYPEQCIFSCGDAVSSLLLILRGKIILSNYSANGQTIMYSVLCVGDIVGHASAIEGLCHLTNATALDTCDVLVINKDIFLNILRKNLPFAVAVATFICAQLRCTLNVIDDICSLDMPARLAKILLALGRNHSEKGDLSSIHISNISQNALADIIGSSRQSVNRILRDWENDGFVMLNRNSIILRNKDQIEQLATSASFLV